MITAQQDHIGDDVGGKQVVGGVAIFVAIKGGGQVLAKYLVKRAVEGMALYDQGGVLPPGCTCRKRATTQNQ